MASNTPKTTETPLPAVYQKIRDRVVFTHHMSPRLTLEALKVLLVDADDIARKRGDYMLCDAIDNLGNPYPSAVLAEWIKVIREELNRPVQQ